MKQSANTIRTKIRWLLALFIFGLVMSGLTAFPLETELEILSSILGIEPAVLQTIRGFSIGSASWLQYS